MGEFWEMICLGSSYFVQSVGQIRMKRKAGIRLQEVLATLVQESGKSCLSAGALLLISGLAQNLPKLCGPKRLEPGLKGS